MLHPFMTQELVRQRRATLDAESRDERPGRQLQPPTRTDPERGRLAVVARTFARQVLALMARPHLTQLPTETVMTTRVEHREPGAITTDRSRSNLTGTWTIDPAHSTISFAWRTLRLWAITGRSDCSGLIHLDELPPVGVIRFQQPSSLPVLTMALDPASLETGAADRNAMLWGRGVRALRQHRWWTLPSQSLEILPSGAWRVMATLTAHSTPGLVELHLEVDPQASGRDWLVLRGRGSLGRRAFPFRPASPPHQPNARWSCSQDHTERE